MDTASVNGNGTRPYASPESHAKLSQHSPTDEQDWSGEGSSGDEAIQASGATKRKRPLSVSCEICKQRKVSTTKHTVSRPLGAAIVCRCVTGELATQRPLSHFLPLQVHSGVVKHVSKRPSHRLEFIISFLSDALIVVNDAAGQVRPWPAELRLVCQESLWMHIPTAKEARSARRLRS